MTESFDIVVVGGGIIGCSVVYQLTRTLPASTRIALLERGPIAGATSGSCMGHLMVTPDNAQEYALSATSVRLWRELQEQHGGIDYNPTGAFYLADSPEDVELLGTLQQQFIDNGDTASVLDNKQLRAIEPGLAEDIPGALFYPGDGVILPMLACGSMLRAAQRANANLRVLPYTEVTAFEHDLNRVRAVRTESARHPCAHAVLACGVWTPEVALHLGLPRLPIYPRRGDLAITAHHSTPVKTQLLEVSYLRFAHGAAQADPTRTDVDAGGHAVNLQPQSHGGCLIGSTRQFCGMKREVNRELLHRSLLRASRYAPGLRTAPVVRTWAGLRPYSVDKHPLIGPWPSLQGCWIAAGHEGLGISLAQVTGLLIAQQIAGVPTAVNAAPYAPGRFA